jgi:hypothetical protein
VDQNLFLRDALLEAIVRYVAASDVTLTVSAFLLYD